MGRVHRLLLPQSNLVSRSADLDVLERRVKLQLHIMNAKIDDIILNLYSPVIRLSDMHRLPHGMTNEGPPQYDNTTPSMRVPVEENTWPLFQHLLELNEALKRVTAPPLGTIQREQLWKLITARFREHELPSQGTHLMFSRDFRVMDRKHLREYSQQSLKQRQTAYRTESLIPTVRRRVYSHDEGTGLATLRLDSSGEEETLHTVDVVTKSGTRLIVSTKEGREWGLVQHLPSINQIHPYTKHQLFNTSEIRLFEPCVVDESDGAVTWRYEGRKPSYQFDSSSDAVAFQCALRGKILKHTFQVEKINSGRGTEGSAQPLKLWSDFYNQNWSLSFLVEHNKPFYHTDVPLGMLSSSIYASESSNKVRVEFSSHRKKRARSSMSDPSIIRRFSGIFRAPVALPNPRPAIEKAQENTNTLAEEELPTEDTRFLTSMAYLKIEFSTSDDAKLFQDTLEKFFAGIDPGALDESKSPRLPSPQAPVRPPRGPSPPTRISPPSPPVEANNQLSSGASTQTRISPPPPPSVETKYPDYRIRGIDPDCQSSDLLSFIGRKLDLEPSIVGRVKSLAISYTGESKVAVISLKPTPACLSTEGRDEWIFGPTSENDDTHITVDTHFRGVTVLYAPPPEIPHTIDICAVAGLGGHAWGSFKHKGTSQSFMWILDELSKHLPYARIMTYGSKTKLDRNESTQSLEELGALLRSELRNVTRRRSPSTLSSASPRLGASFAVPSFFIAHSLGGLTVKEALLQEKADPELGSFLDNLHGALFFGVPSHGMNIKALEAMIKGQPNESLVNSISYQSQTLQKLSRKFKSKFANRKPKIIYFYEMEPSFSPVKLDNGQWKMAGTPKKILVDKDSATDGELWSAGHVNYHPLNRNHSDLVKFSPNDDDFRRVLNELMKLVEDAEAEYEEE
ncbi:hypothetical protein N7474_005909 [Penicillium riverlandense]|uniref:uncharacterized protein n=1 Tax=Penicillium riverlandense TaxID=1903569 RepID=UPI0025465B5B|nr:uncharacterized protein N7474_005909 [Penicillium riverlandense]KAJ5820318.1 hypothetical protein N7474_005909 [Penicillium riverlandense]